MMDVLQAPTEPTAPTVEAAPPPRPVVPERSIRTIESPTAHAVYESGENKGLPKPAFSGVRYGQTFVNGIAQVDEEATWPCVNADTLQPQPDRTWHLLIYDGMRDITPADQPPRYPVPLVPDADAVAARTERAMSAAPRRVR